MQKKCAKLLRSWIAGLQNSSPVRLRCSSQSNMQTRIPSRGPVTAPTMPRNRVLRAVRSTPPTVHDPCGTIDHPD